LFALSTFVPEPASGWIGSWRPGIGDPTLVAWVIVAGYLVASFLCWQVYRGLRAGAGATAPGTPWLVLGAVVSGSERISQMPLPTRLRALWSGLALVLLLLGINKQLDLQTALSEAARFLWRRQGWYGVRQVAQVVFIVGVGLAGVWLFRTVVLLARGNIEQLALVLAGTVFLICFVAIRAASFHHIDDLLGSNFVGFRLNWLLELGGIALVVGGAGQTLRARRSHELS
jgi:hypothetical protein